MATMNDFDLEIQDEKQAEIQTLNGNVATAGIQEIIIPTSGRNIQEAMIINPNKGPRANNPTDLLFVTTDSNTDEITVNRGGRLKISGVFSELKIDSNNSGTNFEILLRS